jgi:hypothetical protein
MRFCLGSSVVSSLPASRSRLVPLAALLLAIAACAGGDDGGDDDNRKLATGDGPCEAASQCRGDVCVALVDGNNPPNYCTQQCGNGGSCPSGFWCDDQTFAIVGLEFCRFGNTPTEEPPAEPPRLPCRDDSDCEGDEVCATFEGEPGCTLPCNAESECTPPSVGGFVVDFLTCGADQTPGASRQVCLPDPACYLNPTSCIRF